MINTIESEVVKSAKVYLAMKLLMAKYTATAMAFHIRTLAPHPTREDYVTPALATSEFQLHNRVAKCQSHLNIVLLEMLLQYAYGRPSMLGDYSVDTYNNTSLVQYWAGPCNPWGDERRVPYIITDHRERRVRGSEGLAPVGPGLHAQFFDKGVQRRLEAELGHVAFDREDRIEPPHGLGGGARLANVRNPPRQVHARAVHLEPPIGGKDRRVSVLRERAAGGLKDYDALGIANVRHVSAAFRFSAPQMPHTPT